MKTSIIITADMETLLVKDNASSDYYHVPIMLSIYFNEKLINFAINKAHYDGFNLTKLSDEMLFSFLKFLDTFSSDICILLYFHNMSTFDGFLFLNFLIRSNAEAFDELLIRSNRIYRIKYKAITILDSWNFISYSLEKAAIIFNSFHYKTKFDFDNINIANLIQDDIKWLELKAYLSTDVKTLYELLNNIAKYISDYFDYNIFENITLYSLSQKIFIQKYLTKFIDINTSFTLSYTNDIFIRQSYKGGTVDVYKPYATNLAYLDFNSMYPAVMSLNNFGIGLPIWTKISEINPIDFFQKHKGFFLCDVICSNLKYPLLSIVKSNNLMQPLGKFSGVFYSDELLYCLQNYPNDYSFNIIRGYHFQEQAPIFKEYIDYLYNIRQYHVKNNEADKSIIVKKMMNSLYGRFGIDVVATKTSLYHDSLIESAYNFLDNILDLDSINDSAYWLLKYKPAADIFSYETSLRVFNSRIDWAAAVTALARIRMHSLTKLVDPVYTDTDSLVINELKLTSLSSFIDPMALGMLKIEGYYDEGVFLSHKVYALRKGNTYKFKLRGIRRQHINKSDEALFSFMLSNLSQNLDLSINNSTNFSRDLKNFSIKQQERSLKYSFIFDKRSKIFDAKGKWMDTQPVNL